MFDYVQFEEEGVPHCFAWCCYWSCTHCHMLAIIHSKPQVHKLECTSNVPMQVACQALLADALWQKGDAGGAERYAREVITACRRYGPQRLEPSLSGTAVSPKTPRPLTRGSSGGEDVSRGLPVTRGLITCLKVMGEIKAAAAVAPGVRDPGPVLARAERYLREACDLAARWVLGLLLPPLPLLRLLP